jgi:uncharacterized membrane protein
MKTNFDQFENDRMIDDPTNYKWGMFYFNPKDSRIVVPKRSRMMGWTLNFANKNFYFILLGFIALSLIIEWLTN